MTTLRSNRRDRATHTRRARLAPGFTLTEILIAIALIVTIVGVAVANLSQLFSGGQDSAAKIFVTSEVNTPLLTYRAHTGSYPSTDQGLRALVAAPDGVTGWHGPYITTPDVPLDPWKHPYQYAYPSTHGQTQPDVWSMGADGQNGTTDDIVNWTTGQSQ